MRIATWNVNSLKARLDRVEEWLDLIGPDVLCLQETKLADDAFPSDRFADRGYESVHHGQGQWNGVAILSRVGLADARPDFADGHEPDPDARVVWATCGGVRVASCYVPNGRSLDDDHYTYKLAWLDRLRVDLETNADPAGQVAVLGDFNIAPDDRDVYDPAAFTDATHVSRAERAALTEICEWGLQDVFRRHHDQAGLFSWWDYRGGNFHKRMGMRIDLILTTETLATASQMVLVDRNARKGESPSDHAPVFADFAV
ncbi:MAG: exodeoxyribonuclease III [Acidimicrobiia bacterium]|nr:exodeoxyribonuclease III [Acidimicrobiia bacterium]